MVSMFHVRLYQEFLQESYRTFRKVKESVNTNTLWHFNPHSDDDKVREKKLIEEIGIENYVFNE